MVYAKNRDKLCKYCLKKVEFEAKIHYPMPTYRQKAVKCLGQKGDFPVSDYPSKKFNFISL